jgi:hypothetical protein
MRLGTADTSPELSQGAKGGDAMPRIKTHVSEVLDSPETCKACAVWQNIESALATVNTLPLPVLEALREHVTDHANSQVGAVSGFLRAFAIYLQGPINAARMRDRRETFGMYRELR